MKKQKRILCLVLVVCAVMSMSCGVSAASANLTIRANGQVVTFPDTQPYIDANGRTMIPVRMVTETLGAEVDWEQKTRTASVSKNGITVYIPIGSETLTVNDNGTKYTVKMDTKAVNKDGRTCVPIRFVAEALGAYVDYSEKYRTVGIYQDEFTAEQIETLRSYPYSYTSTVRYANLVKEYDAEKMKSYYGEYYLMYPYFENSFETAHEYLYHKTENASKYAYTKMKKTGKEILQSNTSELNAAVVKEVEAQLAYNLESVKTKFVADTSCIYQPDAMNHTMVVRGYMYVSALTDDYSDFDLTYALKSNWHRVGYTEIYPVDVFVGTGADVQIEAVVRLDDSELVKSEELTDRN